MNNKKKHYLIIDIGTGNVRVAIADSKGKVHHIERENVNYYKDDRYPEALGFGPNELWNQIMALSKKILSRFPKMVVEAISVSSQREGIVLLDQNDNSIIGLPNHDHRGREWVDSLVKKDFIYSKCGRFPNSLFSAFKLLGLKERRPEVYERMATFLSISDWVQFKLSDIKGYEHSQASETLLYDIEAKKWSEELCAIFNIPKASLPELHTSGNILGPVLPEISNELGIPFNTKVIVGGSDTQLAIQSTSPSLNDVIIVAGTTTPVVKITTDYIIDPNQKTWTNRHIEDDKFILETNAGVTGLNYQRLKEIFYPKDDYDVIEEEIREKSYTLCSASLGSLIAYENKPITVGGFIFDTPISHELGRADFVLAAFWDIACCVKENYDYLHAVSRHEEDYIWGCGGGFRSEFLTQLLSDLLEKKIKIRQGHEHASIIGGVSVCNKALGLDSPALEEEMKVYSPRNEPMTHLLKAKWKKARNQIQETFIH